MAGGRDESAATRVSTDAPVWARLAALAVPLCVLPSAAWRAQHGIDVLLTGPGRCGIQGGSEAAYVLSLSIVSMTVALMTLGLVSRWGEVIPQWVPLVGGKEVPARLVTFGAGAVVAVVSSLVGYYLVKEAFGLVESRPLPPGCSPPDFDILVFYVPLLAWAPLLLALTVQYHRRRQSGPGDVGTARSGGPLTEAR